MIKEPPHFGNDKPWMNQLKNWCRTVKDEFERTALRGDGVTTSISSGVVHATIKSYTENFDYLGFNDDTDYITIGEGYVKQTGVTTTSIAENTCNVATNLADGTYYIVLGLDLSSVPFFVIPYFLTDTIIADDVSASKIYFYLYRITTTTGDDNVKNINIDLDMRNMPIIKGF